MRQQREQSHSTAEMAQILIATKSRKDSQKEPTLTDSISFVQAFVSFV